MLAYVKISFRISRCPVWPLLLITFAFCVKAPMALAASGSGPSVVRVTEAQGKFQLTCDGQPFLIKGAGGSGPQELLKQCGGNSIRTWGADKIDAQLDEAQRLGLKVAVGIWLANDGSYFNYKDRAQVAKQTARAIKEIDRYKNHPAVLLWGLGNEIEGSGDNSATWEAVNALAAAAKKADPNHPTMTVLAEIGGKKVQNFHRLCPDVDILGINSYGGAPSVAERYKKAGGTKPFILTEFGPPGIWETKKNAWGSGSELTSTQKGAFYRRAYAGAVTGEPALCLGSYAFLWGHKQEATATWFGMLLPDNTRLEAVDVMAELWSGHPYAHPCPKIKGLSLDGAIDGDGGRTVKATLDLKSEESAPLRIEWVLTGDGTARAVGGQREATPAVLADAIVKSTVRDAEVKLPLKPGAYLLFAYVRDAHGGGAVANMPLHVKGK